MVFIMEDMVTMIADLGGTVGSLVACFWYIKYQSDLFTKREERWMTKDDVNDEALRSLMKESNSQLMEVMRETNKILQEMKVALSELKETIHAEAIKKG